MAKNKNFIYAQETELTLPHQRIRYVRQHLLKMTRADIHNKYGIPVDTIVAWENGKVNLTEKAVDRYIKVFEQESILVTREWIINGSGRSPKLIFDFNKYLSDIPTPPNYLNNSQNEDLFILKEVEYFKSLYSNAIIAVVTTDDMLPLYLKGDYVGGRLRYSNELDTLIGKDCIIKTIDNAQFIRRIAKSVENNNRYNLVCLNASWGGNPEPVIFNVEVVCAAPIIWHRRLDE